MLLVGGHVEGSDPVGQLSRVVGSNSRFSGVAMQLAPSGSPEQESVTNIGAVSVEVYSNDGVIVTVSDPAWPGVSVSVLAVVDAGVKLESATVNSHSVVTLWSTCKDVEAR
jgi:hypothetical protein